MTKGLLEIEVNQQYFKLTPGDSIYFDAAQEHIIKNISDSDTEFYLVMNHKKANN